jgi:hypothetical protein
MEISRFPSKRLLRMPGSTTTRGQHVSCDIDTGCVAFCWAENISAPDLSYRGLFGGRTRGRVGGRSQRLPTNIERW